MGCCAKVAGILNCEGLFMHIFFSKSGAFSHQLLHFFNMHYFNVKYIQLLFNLQTAVYYFPYKPRKKRGGGSEEEQTGLETI